MERDRRKSIPEEIEMGVREEIGVAVTRLPPRRT
jgi:hypothetical protein